MTLHIRATGVSGVIGIGDALIIPRGHIHVTKRTIRTRQVATEKRRYRNAVSEARRQLASIAEQIPADLPADINSFIGSHLLMLDDSALVDTPLDIIEREHCNAEWALQSQYRTLVQVFEDIDDPYLKTRRDDIAHVVNRIQRILGGRESLLDMIRKRDYSDRIIVIDDLSPAETVTLHQQHVAGFITEYGGPLSHTAILARSLGIPALVGVSNARRMIQSDEPVIIDGQSDCLIASPDKRIYAWYRRKQRDYQRHLRTLTEIIKKPTVTLDGECIELQANIELPEDLKPAKKSGCSGVGLLRTEYLYMNRDDLPDEEEQFNAYRHIIKSMSGAPVTIRTLDLGADKQVDSGRTDSPLPNNPALGLRAIRLCLQEYDMFNTHLRAILRASAYGKARIMIPMISGSHEMRQARTYIEAAMEELDRDGISYDRDIPVGAMIEVPAAAISAGLIARHCDFMSIGTNDLIQYTLAIDRVDDAVNYLYDPLHPAVLKLIQMIINAGRKNGIPVSMCGEMAGDTAFTRLLLGMGLIEFSMHPASLLEVKKIVLNTSVGPLTGPVSRLLRIDDAIKIRDRLRQLNSA